MLAYGSMSISLWLVHNRCSSLLILCLFSYTMLAAHPFLPAISLFSYDVPCCSIFYFLFFLDFFAFQGPLKAVHNMKTDSPVKKVFIYSETSN